MEASSNGFQCEARLYRNENETINFATISIKTVNPISESEVKCLAFEFAKFFFARHPKAKGSFWIMLEVNDRLVCDEKTKNCYCKRDASYYYITQKDNLQNVSISKAEVPYIQYADCPIGFQFECSCSLNDQFDITFEKDVFDNQIALHNIKIKNKFSRF